MTTVGLVVVVGHVRGQRHVVGLRTGVGVVHPRVEQSVDEVDDRGDGAEVLGEVQRWIGEHVFRAAIELDVGPTEPVDRLLRVAHEEQSACIGRRERVVEPLS